MDTSQYLDLFLGSAREQAEIIERSLARLVAGSGDAPSGPLRRAWHTLKGMAATMGFTRLADLCHAAETVFEKQPVQLDALETACRGVSSALASLEAGGEEPADLDTVADAVRRSADSGPPRATPPERPPALLPLPSRVRVATDDLDHLLADAAELDAVVRSLEASLASGPLRQRARAHDPRLDRLRRGLRRLRLRLSRMRLLPFSLLLPSLEKTVGWAARQRGVRVHLQVDGADTQLDRANLDLLVEPLIHLLRNAVAHAAQPPDERLAADKDEALRLHLQVTVEHGLLRVIVQDDGPGVDLNALARRLDPDSASRVQRATPDDNLADVLCRAGLSTRDRVTPLAGRGIGLDAVRAAVGRAGGRIRLTSRPGCGVRVELLLPQNLSLTPCLLARCGATTYGFPLASIAGTDQGGSGKISRLRGDLWSWSGVAGPLPAAPLEALMDGGATWRPPETVALLRIESPGLGSFGVVVDALAGRLDAAVRPLPGPLSAGPCIGTALCGDGTPVAVIDPCRLQIPEVRPLPAPHEPADR